jgi:antirestriction protein ArdC
MPATRKSADRKDVYAIVTERIVAQLEAGVAPWRRPWATSGAGTMPRNAVSKRAYRGVNVFMLLFAQWEKGYEHALWLTYKQAQAAGGQVRKGEQSELVVFWKRIQPKDGEVDAQGNPRRPFMMLRYFNVFNVSQCDGLEHLLPEATETAAFSPIEAAAALADGYFTGSPVLSHGGDRACYSPALDTVRMPKPEAFSSPEEYYSTLFHEATHSTGHASRLARPDLMEGHAFGDESYAKEELVAEMGAAMLCAMAGVEQVTLPNSAAYLGHWVSVLKGDAKLVVQAAAAAQKAADLIAGVTFDSDDADTREVVAA